LWYNILLRSILAFYYELKKNNSQPGEDEYPGISLVADFSARLCN
jgi:hypothetical protein